MSDFRRTLLGAVLVLFAAGGTVGPEAAQAASPVLGVRQKVLATDPSVALTIAQRGGQLLADYGSAQLFVVDAALLSSREAAAAGEGIEIHEEYDRVLLNAGTIDTSSPDVQEARAAAAEAAEGREGKELHLVQFVGPILPAWYDALAGTGARIVTYVPHGAYLVYGDLPALERVRALAARPYVQWDGAYRSEHKIQPAARVDLETKRDQGGAELYEIQMVEDPEANTATEGLIDQRKRGDVRRRHALYGYVTVIVPLSADSLEALAAQPDVVSVQRYVVPQKRDERQDQILAGALAGGSPSGPGYLAFLTAHGFTQAQFTSSGFAVDISDSGIDDGTTSPNHFGLYQLGILGGTGRVAYNRLEGTPNFGSTLQGCDGHGTINAHIVGGYSDLAGFPHTDAAGFRYGLGVAPYVRVGSSVIFDPDFYTFPNFAKLQSRAYRDGARISSNSWGASSPAAQGTYNSDAQAYDGLVRDAQPAGSAVPVAGNQEMVVVFAAGNAGPAAGSVTPPGTAKNVITVGAAENVQAFGGADGCGVGDAGANSANDIISFSSRGPADDLRKKPDLVAPGTHISGGVFQSTTPGGTGQAGACYNGSGVCGGVGSIFFPAGQQFFTASSGTSHSTPAVAGGAALVRQHFINEGLSAPSPAMTKALLMNASRYMTGVGANDTLWSNNQGMGMMDLGRALDDAPRILQDQRPADLLTASGQTRSVSGTIADSTRPFRVTVVWTDAPGPVFSNAFLNNLDLEVTVGGTLYRGNVFSGAFSVAGGVADIRNNAESVFLPAGSTGPFSVTVRATNINSNGVPGVGGALDQDFALVIYNGNEGGAPSLGVSPSSVPPGGPVVVTVAGGPANVTDWVGLYAVGTNDFAYLDWKYLSDSRTPPSTGLTNATLHFNMPTVPGTYEFRFFSNNGFSKLATSPPVTVTGGGGGPSLGVAPNSVPPGGPVVVTVAGGPANVTDWVGLYLVGTLDNAYLDWKYLSDSRTPPPAGLSGATLHFNMPTVPGTYEFRFFANNGFSKLATSPPVTVTTGGASLNVSPSNVPPGGEVMVTVAGGPGNVTDWVGLYAVGTLDNAYLDWKYLSDSRTPPPAGLSGATLHFNMPTVLGTYEFRFFANNGFVKLATSPPVTVP